MEFTSSCLFEYFVHRFVNPAGTSSSRRQERFQEKTIKAQSKRSAATNWISSCFDRSCNPWKDSDGKRIEAHGVIADEDCVLNIFHIKLFYLI